MSNKSKLFITFISWHPLFFLITEETGEGLMITDRPIDTMTTVHLATETMMVVEFSEIKEDMVHIAPWSLGAHQHVERERM